MKTLFCTASAVAALMLATPTIAAQQDQSTPNWGQSPPSAIFSSKRSKEVLAQQIMLAAAQHSPGVIDGYPGGNTRRALSAFQKAHGLDVTGNADEATMTKLREATSGALLVSYVISADDLSGGFTAPGSSMKAMAQEGNVGFASASEGLAERFGMSQGLLEALNPDSDFGEGSEILVVGAQPGSIGTVARVEIDGGANELRAFDEGGKLLASFPATVGSGEFPSPSGSMEVRAIAPEANYTFDPSEQNWGGDEMLVIPAGPNNPVGGIWIDLTKDGYGIHGTPEPGNIGKTSSHGCVRLTNWDAQRLAQAVSAGTVVEFL